MTEQTLDQPIELEAPGASFSAAVLQSDRAFNFALALAAALHVLLIILMTGFAGSSSTQRRIGDPSGADSAISVEMVTDADLRSLSTISDRAPGLPTPPTPPITQQPEPQEAQPQPAEPEPPPPAEAEAPPPEPPAQPAEPPAKAAEPAPAPEIEIDEKTLALPEPGLQPPPKKQETKQPEPKKQETKTAEEKTQPSTKSAEQAKSETAKQRPTQSKSSRTAKLDLSMPPSTFMGSGGAGVERPPGITRSGENDAFAQGVIRALQRTMPQLSNTFGRVTVRITLDMNGSLVRTEVVRQSNVAGLDQNVVFATRQSSFPFPPRNAVPADLVFVVTYIYR